MLLKFLHNVFLSVAIALLKATDVKKTLKHFNDQFFFATQTVLIIKVILRC